MKIALITAASAIFICGTALAREVIVSPIVSFHRASSLTEHRTAQIESAAREGIVLCTTRYVTTIRGDGNSTTRKSVNCEEKRMEGIERGLAGSPASLRPALPQHHGALAPVAKRQLAGRPRSSREQTTFDRGLALSLEDERHGQPKRRHSSARTAAR